MKVMDSVTAISIARTYFTIIVSYNSNEEESRLSFMHQFSLLALWAVVELNVGILAACVTVVTRGVREVFAGMSIILIVEEFNVLIMTIR